MKPLLKATQDSDQLQDIGRASIQIVHDLKNQLNGLKLYATFLRKRMEKSERPLDKQETVNKLILGLERAAEDLSMIVSYGRPLELKKQAGVDLQRIMRSVCAGLNDNRNGTGSLTGSLSFESELVCAGEYDPTLIADAFRSISTGALRLALLQGPPQPVMVRFTEREESTSPAVLIEWLGVKHFDHDPFRSFAGSDEIRMSLAAKTIEAHGGSASYEDGVLRIELPLVV